MITNLDQACYGVLCKMAQKYLMRYPLIDGQGSLGTQEDNDLVASPRYTEAKPSIFTDLMMIDYKKGPVPVKDTYNGEFQEPVVLPGLFPNALCNGRQAIGISMAHSSVPHNLDEVCGAILAYIKNPQLTIDDIMKYIKGPDFPLGGTIINAKDIKTALATGKSSVSLKVRGDYEIDGNKITFTSIPYRTYRNKIKEQLEKNVDAFETVLDDYSDESNIGLNKLVFYAKSGQVQVLLNKLFKLTDLQSTVSYNMNYIVNGTPKLCSIKDLIQAYVEHQNNVLINIAKVDLKKAQDREHVIEGLLIAIKDIDTAIQLIKSSLDKAEARNKLIAHFNITEAQANAVLDMKLSRLTKLDKDDLLKELEEVRLAIINYNKIINDEVYRNTILSEKVEWLKNHYGDARRTIITQIADIPEEEKEIQFVEPEKCVVVMTEGGSIKRIPTTSFRTQKRNGKGVKSQEDITSCVLRTNTIDSLMIFSNKGLMYRLLVNDIPVGTNSSQGTSIRALVNMAADETPETMYSIYRDTDAKFVLFVSKNGLVKKTPLDEYVKTKKKTGIGAVSIREGDSLASVSLIKDEQLLLITKKGFVIRFNSTEITPTSRTASGIKGIDLNDGDQVVSVLPIRHDTDTLALFSESGCGKKMNLSEFTIQKRAGRGVYGYKASNVSGNIIGGTLVSDEDNILIIGDKTSICVSAKDIPLQNRATVGNQLIKNSRAKSITKV